MEATGKKKFKCVLFPTDFSKASEAAAHYATNVAEQYGAKLVVLHVVDLSEEAAGFYLPHLSYENLDKEMISAAEKMLAKFCARVFEGSEYELRISSGEPHEEIIRAAKEDGADILVMGTYGRGGLDRFFFGSTTERVMRKIDRPVLVIPPPE